MAVCELPKLETRVQSPACAYKMETEWEATFLNIDKDEIKTKLKEIGAKLLRENYLQKRITLCLPKGHEQEGAWLRIRNEGNKTTMAWKRIVNNDPSKIENQKEIEFDISDFELAEKFLETIGCKKAAYQESYRELWELEGVEITVDEWPHLEPYMEIEGESEEKVKNIAEKLGLNFKDAQFASTDFFYAKKYNVDTDFVNKVPRICFNEDNPFLKE